MSDPSPIIRTAPPTRSEKMLDDPTFLMVKYNLRHVASNLYPETRNLPIFSPWPDLAAKTVPNAPSNDMQATAMLTIAVIRCPSLSSDSFTSLLGPQRLSEFSLVTPSFGVAALFGLASSSQAAASSPGAFTGRSAVSESAGAAAHGVLVVATTASRKPSSRIFGHRHDMSATCRTMVTPSLPRAVACAASTLRNRYDGSAWLLG
jgi:hypothetical protein